MSKCIKCKREMGYGAPKDVCAVCEFFDKEEAAPIKAAPIKAAPIKGACWWMLRWMGTGDSRGR
jgi:hypothetical protein